MRYLALVALALWAYWSWWDNRSVAHAPGVLAPANPSQKEIVEAEPLVHEGYELLPQADFSIRARVLSTENYFLGQEADLSRTDLALGWGSMSDSSILDLLRITQHSRFYFWGTEKLPISRKKITAHSANMHLIPATDEIAAAIGDVIEGDIVRFRGKLVDATNDDGWRWVTSLSRTDTGKGACELVFVEKFDVEKSP